MYDFTYRKASSPDEAAKAFASADDATYMAGGMTLIPTLKQRLASPSDVIDLGPASELAGIKAGGNSITIGAMTTHATVAASADVRNTIPALASLAGGIGDPAVRHRGTIGGSVANNDPAADYPSAVLGLGATVHTNKRDIAADDFFVGMFETALEEGELITGFTFPLPETAAYSKFPNPASRYAVVGVFVAKTGSGVRVAVTGAGPSVFRATEMEAALSVDFSAKALDGITVDASGLNSDIHASAEYRAHLVGVMAKRAVQAAA
ncbi:carbon monoxide dehydrogenase [Alphaproteobacteria bacterium HT1-32]|nr:carbon monoxide dehydrogenase [Alphaproteobacteria bacterium HT1-32]